MEQYLAYVTRLKMTTQHYLFATCSPPLLICSSFFKIIQTVLVNNVYLYECKTVEEGAAPALAVLSLVHAGHLSMGWPQVGGGREGGCPR